MFRNQVLPYQTNLIILMSRRVMMSLYWQRHESEFVISFLLSPETFLKILSRQNIALPVRDAAFSHIGCVIRTCVNPQNFSLSKEVPGLHLQWLMITPFISIPTHCSWSFNLFIIIQSCVGILHSLINQNTTVLSWLPSGTVRVKSGLLGHVWMRDLLKNTVFAEKETRWNKGSVRKHTREFTEMLYTREWHLLIVSRQAAWT
jgi:hypothetical protein